jgi:hypothetical protein
MVNTKDDLGDYVSIHDNEMDVVFDIDLPYDIPANGKDQHVVLKETNVSSVYTITRHRNSTKTHIC